MHKGFSAPLLLVGIFLILGSILSFVLFSKTSKISEDLKTLSVLQTVNPKKEALETYANQNLGFEFSYSNDLNVKEDSEEEFNQRGAGSASKSVNGDFRKNFRGYVGYEPGKFLGAVVVLEKEDSFEINPFTVWVFDNLDNETIDSWFAKYWYYPFIWGVFDFTSKGHIIPDSEAIISGQPAKYKIIPYQLGKPKFIYISKDQKMYLFRIIGQTGEQILATFKFLEKDSDQ